MKRDISLGPLTSSGMDILIWGDGKQTRSFCYIDDCLEGTYKLMQSDFKGVLNIGSDRLVTIDKLADIVIGLSGKSILKKYNISKPQGVRGRNSDNTLIKKVLGWAPSISLEDGLKRTYLWVAQQVDKKNFLLVKRFRIVITEALL